MGNQYKFLLFSVSAHCPILNFTSKGCCIIFGNMEGDLDVLHQMSSRWCASVTCLTWGEWFLRWGKKKKKRKDLHIVMSTVGYPTHLQLTDTAHVSPDQQCRNISFPDTAVAWECRSQLPKPTTRAWHWLSCKARSPVSWGGVAAGRQDLGTVELMQNGRHDPRGGAGVVGVASRAKAFASTSHPHRCHCDRGGLSSTVTLACTH